MPAQKTVLSFGLVAIPVSLHTAVQENDVGFHQLHKEDQQRIRYKKVCEGCGKEIRQSDIVKGFEFEKDRHVVVTDQEMEAIKTEKEKAIQILHFVPPGEISTVSCARAWYAMPEPGGEKAFELLRRALLDEDKIAIGKTVLGTKEALMAVLAGEDGLIVQSLYFEDEIKDPPRAYAPPKVAAQEIAMARRLVQTMDTPFNPADYKDEYQARLKALLESKISGEAFAAPAKSGRVNVADLMEAFRQSIEQAGTAGKKKPAKETAGKKKGK
ncbi:MAG: Ku protein [Oscillospiraceae bacterium]|nr:Ku protein [Oscillospiraceae bacterium]